MLSVSRTDILITKARAKSLTVDFSDTYGIPDATFVEALQDACLHVQTFLTAEMIEPFTDYFSFNAVANQEAYPTPKWAYLSSLVYSVEYAADGQVSSLEELEKAKSYRRDSSSMGQPEEWYVDADQIFIQPIPQNAGGLFRVRYERMLDLPELRRGKVASHTIVSGALTALRADTTANPDTTQFGLAEYVCVNDPWGGVTMRGIPIAGYDAASGDFTLPAGGYTFEAGETITDGSYLTVGLNATTHSKLPRLFEGWLVAWCRNEVNLLQSSTDEDYTDPNLEKRLAKIAEVYASLPAGRNPIPQTRGFW